MGRRSRDVRGRGGEERVIVIERRTPGGRRREGVAYFPYHMGFNDIVMMSCKSGPLFSDSFVKEAFQSPVKIHT
jgi:hypothetical protein